MLGAEQESQRRRPELQQTRTVGSVGLAAACARLVCPIAYLSHW